MTSETWFSGGHEVERVEMGAAVRRGVAAWGGGHVEAFVNIRGLRPVVESAVAYPFNGFQFNAKGDLQSELDRAKA